MKREQLLRAIECIMPGIDKPGSPLGMDFLVYDRGWLRSFNEAVSVSYFADSPKPIHCAVKAQELYKVLSKMEGENIRMIFEEGKLVIKTPNTTLQMTTMEKKQLESLEERIKSLDTDVLDWENLPKDFIDGLSLCFPGTKSDPILGVLAGVAIKENQIVSTDNKRISLYTMKEKLPKEVNDTFSGELLIPVEVVGDILKYGKDSVNISMGDSWIHFKNSSQLIISTRRMIGEYPFDKVKNVFKENVPDKKFKPFSFPEGLEKSLDRAEILAEIGDESILLVSLRKEGDFLIIKGEKEIGKVEDKIEWKDKSIPEKIEIKISSEFLKKVLKITREFQISPNKNCILFSTPNFKHLMVAKIE